MFQRIKSPTHITLSTGTLEISLAWLEKMNPNCLISIEHNPSNTLIILDELQKPLLSITASQESFFITAQQLLCMAERDDRKLRM
jgi:hypothetical protein